MTAGGTPKTGRCLCGVVRYAVRGELGPADHCHCSMCRRSHGAPFATFVRIRRSDFELLQGAEALTRHVSSPAVVRSFCSRCGSRLFFEHGAVPAYVFVTLTSFDGEPGIAPTMHIFVGSKAEWETITDGLPQFEGQPPMDHLG